MPVHPSGVRVPCILLYSFMTVHQCLFWARVGKPVQSGGSCCSHACGSLAFVVPFLFPGESVELLCTRASESAYVSIVLCKTCASASFRGRGPLCILPCSFVQLSQCMLRAPLVGLCSWRSFVVHMRMDPLCFSCGLFVSWRVCRLVMYAHQSICICQLSFPASSVL